jgi:hypothetical protein
MTARDQSNFPAPCDSASNNSCNRCQTQARFRSSRRRQPGPSKNYRYSTNVQVAIDADTRLVIATGDPQPGNRNDCTVYRESGIDQQLAGLPVVADSGY